MYLNRVVIINDAANGISPVYSFKTHSNFDMSAFSLSSVNSSFSGNQCLRRHATDLFLKYLFPC